jgi:hypothetical protein
LGDIADEQRPASPYSTGGGGTRLEHRLGAIFLGHLLTGSPIAELGELAPDLAAFQQSGRTAVDDLLLEARAADGVSSVRLDIAVRRKPKFIKSDEKTCKLVTALVREDLDAARQSDPLVARRLAVAVSGQQTHARQVAELADIARGQSSAEKFFELVNTPGKFAARGRLTQLRDMVDNSLLEIGDEAAGSAESRCWSLLSRLWIIETNLESGNEGDWTALIDRLTPVALGHSTANTIALRDRLEQVSAKLAQTSGEVDLPTLRRLLHGKLALDDLTRPAGWPRLRSLDTQARANVARTSVGTGASAELKLPRRILREQLQDAMFAGGDIVVRGDSGVGKSALVMDIIDATTSQTTNCQALVVNLRQLPPTQLELLAMLLSPAEELLKELTAADRLLVIDGAEAAAEHHGDVLAYLVRSARSAGVRVVAVVTTEGAGAAKELIKSAGGAPTEFVVPGLDDEDIAIVGAHFPALRRIAEDNKARELLRRPIVVDLLCRAGDPGLPLSDSEALDHVWQHLVRNEERSGAGAPDARARAMLLLAAHELSAGEVDDLLQRLDSTAVDGLRRSGIILPPSRLPWERVPQFKHDLIRSYAVARYLLSKREPADTLQKAGSPRWALPSARLACEILLSADVEPSYPLSGRFAELQTKFDKIAEAGGGKRWADVPSEALISSPKSAILLDDSWPFLLMDNAFGLARMIRVTKARHTSGVLLDRAAAEPLVSRLVTEQVAHGLNEEVHGLVCDWLRSSVLRHVPPGDPTRIALRQEILRQCAVKERVEDDKAMTRQAQLAARTPEEIAADDDRDERNARLRSIAEGGRRRRQKPSKRHRPYLWISDAQIEQLALLGSDLGVDGEAILRRIAEDDPHSLQNAVESFFAGQSLATYDPQLLTRLAEAYYIDDDYEDCDGEIGWSDGILGDGIRGHRFMGGTLSSFTHGPFIAIFRHDYRGGVAFLNRMLTHAARHRVRSSRLGHYGYQTPSDESEPGDAMSLAGESRLYNGDDQVWRWYRGTGVGPWPCMSALQALEFVTEEYIAAGCAPEVLVGIQLEAADNLAMPALGLGILVRHLEPSSRALDPFLVEPTVWEHEFSRANHEMHGPAARYPEYKRMDRRGWSLREVSTVLALGSEGTRIEELRSLGEQLEAKAREQLKDASAPGAQEHLAAVHNWAAALDRAAYELRTSGNQVLIQQTIDPDVEQVLGATNADLRRSADAAGLVVRHAHVRDSGGRAPEMTSEALSDDLSTARDLFENPPQMGLGGSPDGPVAVAASAIELHFTGRATVSQDNLRWSGSVLLGVAADVSEDPAGPYDDSFFSQGADRSAARAFPYLLLPGAAVLRGELGVDGPEDLEEFELLATALASQSANEARLTFARGLDAVWAAPCDTDHLYGRCHHSVAFELVTDSYLQCAFGPWDFERQQRPIIKLSPGGTAALHTLTGDDIYVRALTAALRATGAAAISSACCAEDARRILEPLLAAHQRAMLAFEHGYHHSQSESLVAARAALWQAIDGHDDVVLNYIDRYLVDPRLLAEGLRAIGAAGQELPAAGAEARRLWPQIMDNVLDYAQSEPRAFEERTWGDYAAAALIPEPTPDWHYLTSEMTKVSNKWRSLVSWSPQINRWIEATSATPASIDTLIVAVRELDLADQRELGLPWVERLVERSANDCAKTYGLPEWLRQLRAELAAPEHIARWQRIVDHLVVAGDQRIADLAD